MIINILFIIFILIIYICIIIYFGEVIPSNDNLYFSKDIKRDFSEYIYPNIKLNFKNFLGNQSLFYPSGIIDKNPIFFGYDTSPNYFLYIHGFNSDAYEGYNLLKLLYNTYPNNFFCGINLPGASSIAKESSFTNINVYSHLRFFHILLSTIKEKNIYLISSSTGSSYSIWINNKLKNILDLKIKCMIMFSPNIEPKGISSFITKLSIQPFGLKILRLLRYKYKMDDYYIDLNMFNYLVGILQINRNKNIYKSDIPILVFYILNDNIVDINSIINYVKLYKGKKKIIAIDDNNHNIITKDYLLKDILKNIKSFISEYLI